MRSSFEQFLIDKGYKCYVYIHAKQKLEETNKTTYSSMDMVSSVYIHRDDEDFKIYFGLNEKDMPPTLISPRPKIRITKRLPDTNIEVNCPKGVDPNDVLVLLTEEKDSVMIDIMQRESNEDIYKALKDESIEFVYNLTN